MATDTNEPSPGRRGHDTYGEAAGWKTFDGRPMPRWADLSSTEAGRETQRRWEVAASAIAERCATIADGLAAIFARTGNDEAAEASASAVAAAIREEIEDSSSRHLGPDHGGGENP